MSGFLHPEHIAVFVACAIISGVVSRAFATQFADEASTPELRLGPSRVISALLVVGLLLFGSYFLYVFWHDRWVDWVSGRWLSAGLAMTLLAPALLVSVSLTPGFDLVWDDKALSGPSAFGLPPFGPRRETIRFDEIEEIRFCAFFSCSIRDARGRRVVWTRLYAGSGAVLEKIASRRPDLFGHAKASGGPWG